jgi:hypothetical protein
MIRKCGRPLFILCAVGLAGPLWVCSANAQPSPPRAETPPHVKLPPPSRARDRLCTGGKESADHKTAMKVECFRVRHSIYSADVRDKDGDEGKVKRATCSAPIGGKRLCTLTVEIAAPG